MRERAQGTWELSVAAGRDPDTGAYRRVIRTAKGLSKREAKAALAELEVAVAPAAWAPTIRRSPSCSNGG
ncbi:MAG: hypothetical protein RLZZ623_2980 [Actinomycetota bacterium]|jgi:hypothetical protein